MRWSIGAKIPAVPPTSCAILSQLLNPAVPRLPPWENKANIRIHRTERVPEGFRGGLAVRGVNAVFKYSLPARLHVETQRPLPSRESVLGSQRIPFKHGK